MQLLLQQFEAFENRLLGSIVVSVLNLLGMMMVWELRAERPQMCHSNMQAENNQGEKDSEGNFELPPLTGKKGFSGGTGPRGEPST